MTEDLDVDDTSNPSREPSIGELISRRALLGGAMAAAALPGLTSMAKANGNGPSSFTFKELPHGLHATHHGFIFARFSITEGELLLIDHRFAQRIESHEIGSTESTVLKRHRLQFVRG